MDINFFCEKLKKLKEITATSDNNYDNNKIFEIIKFIDIMYSFISKADNKNSLCNNHTNINDNKNECPLDNMRKSLIDKLNEIDSLLETKMINYIEKKINNELTNDNFDLINRYNDLFMKAEELIRSNLLVAFEVLKHLEGHNKTLIILGPNGSGKTSFANYLKNVDSHIKVIPADKPIKTNGNIPGYFSDFEMFNNELYGNNGTVDNNILQKLIVALCNEHDDISRECKKNGGNIATKYEKVKSLFEEFFEVKLDDKKFSNKQLLSTKYGKIFDFNSMSDGERTAFFYIATVIVAPEKSFIIVDEPENHLNPAIYNKIWDRLIADRSDCQFIFISHTLEFINARSNYELVKIKKFTYPNNYEFEFLGEELLDVSNDFIVEIIGSRKPILFCEGSKNKYDYKVYEILFGDKYTLIPAGNCRNVIKSVEACNMHSNTYSIEKAKGIIDSDLKSDSEIKKLKLKEIFVLRCNEIEMMLLDEDIFKAALTRVFKKEDLFDEFSEEFFEKINNRKDYIIKRMVKTCIEDQVKNFYIDDKKNKNKDELKNNLNEFFSSLDVDSLWEECYVKISKIIKNKDYNLALKYCCLEHNEVIGGICNRYVSDYLNIAFGVLRDNIELAGKIKNKYFLGFTDE